MLEEVVHVFVVVLQVLLFPAPLYPVERRLGNVEMAARIAPNCL
ncbi:MAG: hypothetical protein R3B51_06000 [Thermodesulfobacteriota bacterium]